MNSPTTMNVRMSGKPPEVRIDRFSSSSVLVLVGGGGVLGAAVLDIE